MADNVNITAGTGTVVATDQVGTEDSSVMTPNSKFWGS